ncbi:MAG: hypothetical protein IPK26_10030 [Planctomycetes bacterium]|nr:hypothetical protein [Planctomycetota bacterium]
MVVAIVGVILVALPMPQEPIRCNLLEPSTTAATQSLRAALPLPRGELRLPDAGAGREPIVAVQLTHGERTLTAPALPLWRWPDGSAGVLLLTAQVPFSGGEHHGFLAEPLRDRDGVAARASMPTHQPAMPDPLPLWTELTDPWDRVHVAHLEPDPEAGPGGVLFDTGVLRARRFVAMHRLRDGAAAGRPLLPLRAWLLTWHGERHGELTLQLANPANGDRSLGPIRFGAFALRVRDPRLHYRMAFADEQAIPPSTPHPDGGVHQWLLPPAATHYLGEGTAKTFRLQLFHDDGATDAERAAGPRAAALALPDLDATRRSKAFGAHGGPAPRVEGAADLAGGQVGEWRRQGRFGPFGDFGDPANGGAPGAPRNGPTALHNVLRWQSAELWQIAEGMLLQHSLRPTPGQVAHAPEDLEPWRRGLGPRAIAAPHGFTMPDYEHASVLLPYDCWWLTGDPYARDELARLRSGLWTVLRNTPFLTSRGEGWCLQSLALIARATGDAPLLADLRQHVRERLLPALSPGRQVAIAQPAHADVLDGKEPFDAPWQMAALIHGLHAVWAQTGDPAIRDGMLRVAAVMAGPGWLQDHGPKTFVAAPDASRYSLAATPADDAGTAVMTVGAFALAAEVASDPQVVAQMNSRVELLLGRFAPAQELHRQQVAAANVWLQFALDRRSGHQ